MQIDHLTVPVRDYETAKRFYAEALRPLGFEILLDWHDRKRAYFGVPDRPSSFWVVESTFAGALEVSLAVPDVGSVAAFHAASLAAGGAEPRGAGRPAGAQRRLLRRANRRLRRQLDRSRHARDSCGFCARGLTSDAGRPEKTGSSGSGVAV